MQRHPAGALPTVLALIGLSGFEIYGPQGRHELGGTRAFGDVFASTCRPGGDLMLALLASGEHHGFHRRANGRNLACCVDAAVRHIHVKQQNVGALMPRNAHCIAAALPLRHHLEFGRAINDRNYSMPKSRMVVDDGHTDDHFQNLTTHFLQ